MCLLVFAAWKAGRINTVPKINVMILAVAHMTQCLMVVEIQSVSGVKATNLGFNSRADSETKMSYTHMGPIRNGSGVMSF